MDKKKILKVLTKEWQTTDSIAKKLKTYSAGVIAPLYELFIDDKKVERIKVGKNTVWKLK